MMGRFHNISSLNGVFYEHFDDIVAESEYQNFQSSDEIAEYLEKQIKGYYPGFYHSIDYFSDHIEVLRHDIDDNNYTTYMYVDEVFIERFKEYVPHLFI